MSQPKISSVLFVCGRNAVRSPMAKALSEQICPGRFYLDSAGVLPGQRDPFVDAVLAEVGLDLGSHKPQGIEDLADLCFDLAITLSPQAHHRMLELTRTESIEVEYWPAAIRRSRSDRASRSCRYRDLRERLSPRIRTRLAANGSQPK
jgi:protein-tyrosine-phosphatase